MDGCGVLDVLVGGRKEEGEKGVLCMDHELMYWSRTLQLTPCDCHVQLGSSLSEDIEDISTRGCHVDSFHSTEGRTEDSKLRRSL